MEKTFTLTLNNTEYTIEVHGNTFSVNDHPFVVGIDKDGAITVDGIAYDVKLDGDNAIVDGVAHALQVSGLEAGPVAAAPPPPPAAAAGAGAIRAIMPGTIVRVLIAEGDQVASGDVVLVLEAMKMENELRAPISGVVNTIHVQPGQAVEMNAVLVEIESV